MGIFDYARNKIHKEYSSREDYSSSDAKAIEEYIMWDIDYYEEQAKKNLKSAITYRIKALWKAQTEDEKSLIGAFIAVMALFLLLFLLRISDTPLNITILKIAEGSFFCFAVLSVLWLYRLIRNKRERRRCFYVAWAFYLMLSLPHIPVMFGYETTQIGDFYEAREYTEEYYVIFSRKPQGDTSRKQYMLPALIERRLDYIDTTEDGQDICDLIYHINYLYFSNGGYLSFDYDGAYDDAERSAVILGQETKVEDYHGNIYYITLTDEKVERS